MKLMIASDIHGSAYYCNKLMLRIEDEKIDRLLLLGDILYHGPRNDLPKEYAPKEVIRMLNSISDKILCVRGNCESEVDQMVLDFTCLSESALLSIDGIDIFATHGHIYGEKNPPKLHNKEILLCGHTHIPKCVEYETFTYINPGSVSIPKEDSYHGYIVFENRCFTFKDLDGEIKNVYYVVNHD